jgi:uracil-DNA glycosylase
LAINSKFFFTSPFVCTNIDHLFHDRQDAFMQTVFQFEPSSDGTGASPALPKVEYGIPADGEPWNRFVLVGEAPGAEEVRRGHPFVGRSGQLLDKILDQATIVRKHCVVTNVFRYQPPGNKVDYFFTSRREAKEQQIPIAEAYGDFGGKWCRTAFAGEIENLYATIKRLSNLSPPNAPQNLNAKRPILAPSAPIIIMALGRTSLWALTGENGLLDKVGRALSCRFLPNVKVIPTFHPSFILRGNWKLQTAWLEHFLTAKEVLLQQS